MSACQTTGCLNLALPGSYFCASCSAQSTPLKYLNDGAIVEVSMKQFKQKKQVADPWVLSTPWNQKDVREQYKQIIKDIRGNKANIDSMYANMSCFLLLDSVVKPKDDVADLQLIKLKYVKTCNKQALVNGGKTLKNLQLVGTHFNLPVFQ